MNDPKAFIEYSNDMQDAYKNIGKHDLSKKSKILVVFDYLIADMINNEKLYPVITKLFIRDGILSISIAFITQSYF